MVKLKGGLGNQMFQYAAGRAISVLHRKKLFLDLEFLETNNSDTDIFTARKYELSIFNFQPSFFSPLRKFAFKVTNALIRRIPFLPDNSFNVYDDLSNFDTFRFPVCLDGFFQSENFFSTIRNIILNDFSFKKPIDEVNRGYAKEIENCNSVSVHFRRSDYVKNPAASAYHGTCSLNYYSNAVRLLKSKITDPVFFIFSDDPQWVQQEFINKNDDLNCKLIDVNRNEDSWKDLFLMSMCRHNIIANSSFSWWAAWLNQNKDKIVMAPNKWTKKEMPMLANIHPKDWIKINIDNCLN